MKQKEFTNYYFFIVISMISLLFLFKGFLIALTLALVFTVCANDIFCRIPVKSIKLRASIISLSIAAFFVVPFLILISIGANESLSFLKNVEIIKWVNSDKLYNLPWIKSILDFLEINKNDFTKLFSSNLLELKKTAIVKTQELVYEIPNILFNFSIMISAIYFMLVDGYKIRRVFYQNFIYDKNVGNIIVNSFVSTSWAVLISTLASAMIQTIIIVIPTLLVNFNNTILVAFGIFIFSMIPIIGTVPVIAALVFYHISLHQYGIAIVYVVLGFIIGFVDSILKALILQRKAKINPFIALLSTMAGISVFGIFGLILGPIIIITLLKLFLFTLKVRRKSIIVDNNQESIL